MAWCLLPTYLPTYPYCLHSPEKVFHKFNGRLAQWSARRISNTSKFSREGMDHNRRRLNNPFPRGQHIKGVGTS